VAWFGSAPGKVHDQASLLHTLILVSVFHAFITSTAAEYNRLDVALHYTYFWASFGFVSIAVQLSNCLYYSTLKLFSASVT
jgi:hypothetical protein